MTRFYTYRYKLQTDKAGISRLNLVLDRVTKTRPRAKPGDIVTKLWF